MKKAILFCYHRSKDTRGRPDTKKLTKIFKKKNIKAFIKYGYLQNAKPSISSQINLLLKKKIKKITIIPGMIFSGNHVIKDIPAIVNKFQKENKHLKISVFPPLMKLTKFFSIIERNINHKIRKIKKNDETCLIIVASNTLNKDAIKQMKQILKKISSKYNFKNSFVIMIGSKSVQLKEKLLILNKKGYSKFILVPIFLFRGQLLQNCINVVNYFKKSKKSINCILLPHIKNYEKISNFLTKLGPF